MAPEAPQVPLGNGKHPIALVVVTENDDSNIARHPARVSMPFGDNPRPPAGSICSLEIHASDGEAAGRWFGEHFGLGAAPAMPQFVAFDPGAGISGVFQSHTPLAYFADFKDPSGTLMGTIGE